jgi:FdhD protein
MKPLPSAYLVQPNPLDPTLTEAVQGIDQDGRAVDTRVPVERPLTLFLNGQEIVTMMTIGDYPDYLALGYLVNQRMLLPEDEVTGIDFDAEIETIVVRTARRTDYEERLKKKTQTSGCAQGTVFGNMMDAVESVALDAKAELKTSWIYSLSKQINLTPSLYLEAGAIHGCVLCEGDRPLIYMEDVGRHNAIDKIAGYMRVHGIPATGKLMYTTGRLTSEMVIKTAQMGIAILISRSGFTAWGVQLARQIGMTLIGRAKGKRFVALSGAERLRFDADPSTVGDEDKRSQRKGGSDDEAAAE